MSGTQFPADFIRAFADLQHRVSVMERNPPSAMNLLGSIQNIVGDTGTAASGAFVALASSAVTFTLPRASAVFALASINCTSTAVSAPQTTVLVDGVQNSAYGPITYDVGNSLTAASTPFVVVPGMTAGAHSCSCGISIATGQTWVASTYYLYVFTMGG